MPFFFKKFCAFFVQKSFVPKSLLSLNHTYLLRSISTVKNYDSW